MSNNDLFEALQREQKKLNELRAEEQIAYSAFCELRTKRNFQENEVNYLFRRMMDQKASDIISPLEKDQ